MNLDSPTSHKKFTSKTLWILALLGFLAFFAIQILPMFFSNDPEMNFQTTVIEKDQARQTAEQFAINTLDMQKDNLTQFIVTYQSDSNLYGYLSREKLAESYVEQYEQQFPYDVFRVHFNNPSENMSVLNVDIHMTTGKVVGFETVDSFSLNQKDIMLQNNPEQVSTLLIREGSLTLEKKQELAIPYLSALGFNAADLNVTSGEEDLGLTYTVPNLAIGESQAEVKLNYEYGKVISLHPAFSVPTTYTDYISNQTTLANWLTYAGYFLFTFVLSILAIVYSAKTRMYTSFRRGIFLMIFYFAVIMITTFNMMPVFEAEGITAEALTVGLVIQLIVTLMNAAGLYFSLVGGDGLWRKQDINIWPRAKEIGYGRHVLQSMSDGYAWAFILLGVQSLLFLVLENTLHSWSTTDASQSTYNMVYPWLFPILAWTAGISEEAIYRLFGIAMLKKIVKNTVVASIITTLIWALGHTLYPIYPVFTRPIELLFIGLLFSFIFIRYGFITAVFAHVIFDSILMGLSLIFMADAINISAGIFYIVLPIIVAFVIDKFNPKEKEREKEPLYKAPSTPTAPHPEEMI